MKIKFTTEIGVAMAVLTKLEAGYPQKNMKKQEMQEGIWPFLMLIRQIKLLH
ncbi:MAG: hypothetical protein MI921_10790 [Cytophagales bacterium]|nr:hypothetical protein [Cytophagales bacterium]